MADEKLIYTKTKTIQPGKSSGFCPGCMHDTIIKLIGEVLEELDIADKTVSCTGVGCCGLFMEYIDYDYIQCAHGRASAVATGVKRGNPDKIVYSYQGDGDFASIGFAESVAAANRGENITVIFVNNGIYGMTGGQMAPTTLLGMKATTAPGGRNAEEHGYPMHVCEIINQLTAPKMIVRTTVDTPQNVIKTRKYIEKAFKMQLEGKGYAIIEIVATCPTNWGLGPLEAIDFMRENMLKEFPVGEFRMPE